MTTHAIRTEADFREIVVDVRTRSGIATARCTSKASSRRPSGSRAGASWDEVFTGFCDGIDAGARGDGVIVRLTPTSRAGSRSKPRWRPRATRSSTATAASSALGLGGLEAQYPPEPYEPAFRLARDGGLGSVPHAGEVAGPESIRGALDALRRRPDPPRHPRGRGPGAAARARRARRGLRRLPGLEPADSGRRRRSTPTRCRRCSRPA